MVFFFSVIVLFTLEGIRKLLWLPMHFGLPYRLALKKALHLTKKNQDYFQGKQGQYPVDIAFVGSSSHLFGDYTIRLSIDFLPKKEFDDQYQMTEALNTKYKDEYVWLANTLYKDVEFFIKRPSAEMILFELKKMESILQTENLEPVGRMQSEEYGRYWDTEISK